VAIGLLLLSIVSISFTSFRNAQTLENSVSEIISLIREARGKTLSSEDSSQYGLHFEASRMVFFKGTVFKEPGPAAPYNREIQLSPLVEISSISLAGGGSDVIFKRLTGGTNQYGSVVLRVKSDTSKTRTININSTGAIDVN
jgi:hypothetical protein